MINDFRWEEDTVFSVISASIVVSDSKDSVIIIRRCAQTNHSFVAQVMNIAE